MGLLKRISGWLLKQNSVPYNRLIKGHIVSVPTDFADKDYVDEAYELGDTNLTNSIGALMARMGLVVISTNIPLTNFPNPISVNGRNYTLVNRQRVLLIAQTTPSQNGVYEVSGTNLVRINDLIAGDGITLSTNNISLRRWSDVTNALRFNGSGEAQVRIKNSGQVGGQDVFTGWQVEPTTGEIYTLFSSLPGANGSLSVEQLLSLIGVASKMNFTNDFTINWDGANTRATVALNPNRPSVPQAFGGWYTTFESTTDPVEPASQTSINGGYFKTAVSANATFTFTRQQDSTEKIMAFCAISQNPNDVGSGLSRVAGTQNIFFDSTFNHFFKARYRVVTLAQTNTRAALGFLLNFVSGANPTNALYFRGVANENSGRWQCISTKAGVSTIVNTTINCVSSTYSTFEINCSLGVATFRIDGVLVATISTNLPDTVSNLVAPMAGIAKTTTQIVAANDVIRMAYLSYYYSTN